MFDLFECFMDDYSTWSPDPDFWDATFMDEWSTDYLDPSDFHYLHPEQADVLSEFENFFDDLVSSDPFPFLDDWFGNDMFSDSFDLSNLNEATETSIDFSFFDFGDLLTDLWDSFEPGFPNMFSGENLNLVGYDQFDRGGAFDLINQCIVEGNVARDIGFIQEQTGSTCSLMAQEQFIARLTGHSIPEIELERIASEMGVYDPNMGTFADGWNAILNYFGIPNTSYSNASIDMLDAATQKGDDVLIGVDAGIFYNDPTFPPGSGHAVTVVGRAIDAITGLLNGFYITDSNFPGQAHFKSVDELNQAWYNDMITVQTA